MNPNQLALLLRQYAEALERLEVMKAWIAEYGTKVERVRVDWNTASAVPGYREVSEAVSREVADHLPRLLDQALCRQARHTNMLAGELSRAQR